MALRGIGSRLPSVGAQLARPAPVADPFYRSREWQALARVIKAQRGYRCEEPTCRADMSGNPRGLIADHVVERKDGGADFDPLNIRLLCIACHNRKTAGARTERHSKG
jgi:5-methylcytosine-specific restriction endonuclease McrA